jgi:uncharacterized protein YukE
MTWFATVEGFLAGPPGDVDGMRGAAAALELIASDLRRLARSFDQRAEDLLSGANAWQGPAADRFKDGWSQLYLALLTSADAFGDMAQALLLAAASVDDAQSQHQGAMLLLGPAAGPTVDNVLLGGADPIADVVATAQGGAAVQAIVAEGGDALGAALARAALEFDRISGVARRVAVETLPIIRTGTAALRQGQRRRGSATGLPEGAALVRGIEMEMIQALERGLLFGIPAPPETPAATVAKADDLAARFTAAIDADDPRKLWALCSELGERKDDPIFTSELFNRLGAEGTLVFAQHVHDFNRIWPWDPRWSGNTDRDFLQPFDEALATATRSSRLHADFISDLVTRLPPQPLFQDDVDAFTGLLRHGVFSTTMLVAATGWATSIGPFHIAPVLDALSRNPDAARRFLLDGPSGMTNLVSLLVYTRADYDEDQRALGHLLEVATTEGTAADARADQLLANLVHSVGEGDVVNGTEAMRQSLARIVAAHPQAFALGAMDLDMAEGDVEGFLREVMQSDAATATLIAGASAYLLQQLQDPSSANARPKDAGRLFGFIARAGRDRLAHAEDGARLLPAVLGLVRATPQFQAVNKPALAVSSVVQLLLGVDAARPPGRTFRDRVSEALNAVRAEALWNSGRASIPPPNDLLVNKADPHSPLLPYAEIKEHRNPAHDYWSWVNEVTQISDPVWGGVFEGFSDGANS